MESENFICKLTYCFAMGPKLELVPTMSASVMLIFLKQSK